MAGVQGVRKELGLWNSTEFDFFATYLLGDLGHLSDPQFPRLYRGEIATSKSCEDEMRSFMCSFVWLLESITTNLVAENNRNFFCYSSGGQLSEISITGLKSRCQ